MNTSPNPVAESMPMEVQNLILSELQKLSGKQDELNDKLDAYMLATEKRLTWLETQTKLRVGNGQPGLCQQRLVMIEAIGSRVTKLEQWRFWVLGICSAVGVMLGAALTPLVAPFIEWIKSQR